MKKQESLGKAVATNARMKKQESLGKAVATNARMKKQESLGKAFGHGCTNEKTRIAWENFWPLLHE